MDYKKFYELSFDLMCIVGPTHFLSVNDKFPRHLGYSKQEMLEKPWLDFIHPDDRAAALVASAQPSLDGSTVTNRYRTKDGRYVWLEWRCGQGDDGQTYATCRDVTAKKNVEAQLEKNVEDLKRSNDELEQFAYAASHDLQEPLRTISNYAQFIQEDYVGEMPAEIKEHLGYIVEAAKQGRALVNDLLELSRVGRSTHFEWVSLNEIVDQAVVGVEFQVREAQALVVRDNLPLIWGDATALTFLFRNLLSNAIKFGKEGVSPTVNIGGVEEASGWHLWVRDNGIGIEPRYANQIFAVFKRLDNSRPGTGIGLSICRKIVDLHHGRIWVESELGAGATFHISIPRPDHHAFPPAEHSARRGPSAGRTDGPSGVREAPSAALLELGTRRGGSTALLAAGGDLRDRPTPRTGSARPQPPQGHGVRRLGGGKG